MSRARSPPPLPPPARRPSSCTAAEASHGDLGMITADDVIMALSWSGEQPEMKNLITYAKRFRIALIAMTANADSTLSKAADVALTLPKAREACPHNLAPTTSSLMLLALGDALAIALLEGRGFTSVDFSVLHPGGKLGAMLKYRPRPHAYRRRGAAQAARHQDVRRAGRDVLEGFWLRRHRRCRRRHRRHRHRRRPAPSHAARPDDRAGRRRHDEKSEDDRAATCSPAKRWKFSTPRRSPR